MNFNSTQNNRKYNLSPFFSLSGNKKAVQAGLKPASADDSSVAIIKKQGLNGVKIQLNLNEQVLAEESETELSNHEEDFVEPPVCPEEELVCGQKLVKNASSEKVEKRKYTLEELEVEGFAESTSSSAKNSDFEEEEVDLNSLIEGDVDEIDEELGKKLCIFFFKV